MQLVQPIPDMQLADLLPVPDMQIAELQPSVDMQFAELELFAVLQLLADLLPIADPILQHTFHEAMKCKAMIQ